MPGFPRKQFADPVFSFVAKGPRLSNTYNASGSNHKSAERITTRPRGLNKRGARRESIIARGANDIFAGSKQINLRAMKGEQFLHISSLPFGEATFFFQRLKSAAEWKGR